ncbi:MAG: hypothetical protein JXB38_01995 [Anaerolineales bacterium]|nr:hypothetical protein [Anaerolineales bacterium]
MNIALIVLFAALSVWLILEIGLRLYLQAPLQRDFYSSLPRERVRQRQEEVGVQVVTGPGWAHLGWIADPENETYLIQQRVDSDWEDCGTAEFGSFLVRGAGSMYRVCAVPKDGSNQRMVDMVSLNPRGKRPPIYKPVITGAWQPLFKPHAHGQYVNDHCIYQDAAGQWRLIGITDQSDGNYNQETYFTVGTSADFPPENGMQEAEPVADFGELAWAPHVLRHAGQYHLFWSPHKLHHLTSPDGITWEDQQVIMKAPYHYFFRDAFVLQVAESQWLLYATGRGRYFSRIDVYQSFNLEEWQYIGPALESNWGSERNAPFASMESPRVLEYAGRHYLSFTYNNGSTALPGILMALKIWPNKRSYNDTLVLHSDNPYNFGTYTGKARTPNLAARLQTHAPAYVKHPESGQWYLTTAGWPWVATLTSGEVAVAPLEWQAVQENKS